MIIDNLANAKAYEQINPLFKKAFDYLKTIDFDNVELGKIELQSEDLFLMISNSQLKTKQEAKLEAHNRYIDIQMPISKSETMGWATRSEMKTAQAPFDEAKDIQFFEDAATTHFSLSPGSFVIFFPEDAHAPCIGEGTVKKIVVKIKSQFK